MRTVNEAGKLGYLCILASHNLCYKVILSVYDVKIVLCRQHSSSNKHWGQKTSASSYMYHILGDIMYTI